MRKSHIALSLLLIAVLIAGSISCASPAPTPAPAPAPAPKAEPIVLKAIAFLPESNARTIVYRKWLDLINERAKGELVFDFLGGPEVIAYKEQPQAPS